MNRTVPRAEIEKFTAGLAEKRRRLAKSEQSTRGYRDEEGVWRGGLLSFVRHFWHVLEPGTKFTGGWVPEAVCEHLEAVTFGDITNLLINVFPGASKSIITNCMWPAWEWGPMELHHVRYVTFSYSSANTERDNQRFADLISSPQYQAMYPHVKVRQTGVTKVANYNHGWKLASSVGGVGTGQRGNRAICFPYDQIVQTEQGPIPIGKIVEERLDVRVLSVDVKTGYVSFQPISGWHKNPGSEIVKITMCDGSSIRCTPNHRFWDGSQWVEASCLQVGTALPIVWQPDAVSNVPPCAPNTDALDSRALHTITGRKNVTCVSRVASYFYDLFFGEKFTSARLHERSMANGVIDVLLPSSIFKITRLTVKRLAIFVAHFLPFRARSKECISYQLVNRSHVSFAGPAQIDSKISMRRGAFHYFPRVSHEVSAFFVSGSVGIDCSSASTMDNSRHTPDAPEARNFVVSLKPNHRTPFLTVKSISFDCHVDCSYCLSVESNHNFVVGLNKGYTLHNGLIASNCDDLNNIKESESKTVMEETNRWFRESLSSRLNNMETDAKVVIGQRVAEGDVSGEILNLGLPYSHLCIPMEFEWQADEDGNPYTTQIGWVDPRWRPDPEDCNGELAWPERFSEKAVQALKIELGPYAVAAQLQQTPEARGGGILKREFWQPAEQYMTGNKFPAFEYVIASLDGAFDEKEENDPSALTIWGIFQNEHGYNRAMLVHAWAKKLQISGPKVEIMPGEHEMVYRRRAMPHWGLVEWTADTCNRFKVDRLLIENKASGKPAAQSLQNSHGRAGWQIQLVEPKGDKYARGLAVQPSFSQDMIYAPDREWAQDVIDQCAIFPKGRHDDLYDSVTQAIKHLRDTGLLRSDEDRRAEEVEALRHKGAPKAAPYPGFRRRQG